MQTSVYYYNFITILSSPKAREQHSDYIFYFITSVVVYRLWFVYFYNDFQARLRGQDQTSRGPRDHRCVGVRLLWPPLLDLLSLG